MEVRSSREQVVSLALSTILRMLTSPANGVDKQPEASPGHGTWVNPFPESPKLTESSWSFLDFADGRKL